MICLGLITGFLTSHHGEGYRISGYHVLELIRRAVRDFLSLVDDVEMRTETVCFFFFQAEDGIRDLTVTGVQTCALPILGFGPLPPGDERIPLHVRQHAYQTALVPHPSRTKFAAATRFSDRLEVFALDGDRKSVV